MQIKDRTFIVSGGSSGLGLATTSHLLSNGASVSILDLNPPFTRTPLFPNSQRVLFSKTDVSSSASIQDALKSTLEWTQQSKKPLSGVICCAGIGTADSALPRQPAGASPTNVKYMDMGLFDKTITINLRGTVDLIRLCLPHMAQNEPWGPDGERGVVIIVSSAAAYEGQVGQLAYSASKGAVRSIVLPLARELGQKAGIRVMGIAPGLFETGMTKPKPQSKPAPTSNVASSSTSQPQSAAEAEIPKAIEPPSTGKAQTDNKTKPKSGGKFSNINPEMVQYPMRMGKGSEFASLVQQIIENPMLNGNVIRLDGAVIFPSRLS